MIDLFILFYKLTPLRVSGLRDLPIFHFKSELITRKQPRDGVECAFTLFLVVRQMIAAIPNRVTNSLLGAIRVTSSLRPRKKKKEKHITFQFRDDRQTTKHKLPQPDPP